LEILTYAEFYNPMYRFKTYYLRMMIMVSLIWLRRLKIV